MNRLSSFSMLGLCCLAFSCAAGKEAGSGGDGSGDTTASSGQATTVSGSSVASSSGAFGSGSGGGGGPPLISEVFGHSIDTLYKLNPDTKAVGVVGPFVGCSGVLDIALDKDSKLYATTQDGLYTVDKTTAVCTQISAGTYPNSLSFVPAGTVDPNDEALVGYVLSGESNPNDKTNQYVRIDPTTGAIANIGNPWSHDAPDAVTSGDIVSVKDGPTYLTLKHGDCDTSDCLAEVNPQTGALVKNYGKIGSYTKVFGLSFWAGSVYGFSNAGELFEIKIQGNALLTTAIDTPAGLSFWGAGSTTSAPPVPQ